MIVKFVLPVLALLGILLAVVTVRAQSRTVTPAQPVAQPATAPFEANVPGAGLVESSTENIAVGTNVAGIVTRVFVKAGDHVAEGAPLFSIDDRSLRAELSVREAAVTAAQRELDRLMARPRKEELPPARARVTVAQKLLEDAQSQLAMWENVPDKRAISADTLSQRRYAVAAAEARLAEADAEFSLLVAGTWQQDINVQMAAFASAKEEAQRVQTEINRLTVRAPVACDVLKVNIRAGEYAQVGVLADPLMLVGETSVLHIRVDIDENDAWRVKEGSPGVAYVRGNSKLKTPIRFVRFEPYVIPKRSLTGASGERVDTRVLQVIYAFDKKDLPVFVGQQMDVFIQSQPIGDAKFGADPSQAARDLQENAKQ